MRPDHARVHHWRDWPWKTEFCPRCNRIVTVWHEHWTKIGGPYADATSIALYAAFLNMATASWGYAAGAWTRAAVSAVFGWPDK